MCSRTGMSLPRRSMSSSRATFHVVWAFIRAPPYRGLTRIVEIVTMSTASPDLSSSRTRLGRVTADRRAGSRGGCASPNGFRTPSSASALGRRSADDPDSQPPPTAAPANRLGAGARSPGGRLGPRPRGARGQLDRDPDRRRRSATSDRRSASRRAVARAHDRVVSDPAASRSSGRQNQPSSATCSLPLRSASMYVSLLWAGAPLPLFRPSRAQVREPEARTDRAHTDSVRPGCEGAAPPLPP